MGSCRLCRPTFRIYLSYAIMLYSLAYCSLVVTTTSTSHSPRNVAWPYIEQLKFRGYFQWHYFKVELVGYMTYEHMIHAATFFMQNVNKMLKKEKKKKKKKKKS